MQQCQSVLQLEIEPDNRTGWMTTAFGNEVDVTETCRNLSESKGRGEHPPPTPFLYNSNKAEPDFYEISER